MGIPSPLGKEIVQGDEIAREFLVLGDDEDFLAQPVGADFDVNSVVSEGFPIFFLFLQDRDKLASLCVFENLQRPLRRAPLIEILFVLRMPFQFFDAFFWNVDFRGRIFQIILCSDQTIHPRGEGIFHERTGVDEHVVEAVQVLRKSHRAVLVVVHDVSNLLTRLL